MSLYNIVIRPRHTNQLKPETYPSFSIPRKIMTAVTVVLHLLTFTLFVATSVQLPQPDGCSPVLAEFSPCLPYVSASYNNTTETVSSQCCDAVNSAFSSGHGDCLCEPLRQPLLFGFPLNETRLRSLSSVCHTSGSLESICPSGIYFLKLNC